MADSENASDDKKVSKKQDKLSIRENFTGIEGLEGVVTETKELVLIFERLCSE